MAREPRKDVSIWVGHLPMIEEIYRMLNLAGQPGLTQYLVDNKVELANLFGALKSGDTEVNAPIVLADWNQTFLDANGNKIPPYEQEDKVTGRRRVSCIAGQPYSVRFTVQAPGPHGYLDAFVQVRPSIAIVPSGAGLTSMSVAFEDGTPAGGEESPGSGAASVTFAYADFERVKGKQLIATFSVAQNTDVFLDIGLPTAH